MYEDELVYVDLCTSLVQQVVEDPLKVNETLLDEQRGKDKDTQENWFIVHCQQQDK